MTDYLLIVVGLAVGLLAGYLLAVRRAREAVLEELERAQRRAAQSFKAARDEIAGELDRKDHTIATLEARLEEERHQGEAARSRLHADLAHAQTERTRLETRAQELTRQAETLSIELRQASDESMQELEELHEISATLEQTIQRMEARLLAVARRVKESEAAAAPAPMRLSR